MKELVILSGKGGTGKTSISASFAVLSGQSVIADCDVDAADLHLVLSQHVQEQHDFYSGHLAVIRPEDCIDCGICIAPCRFGGVIEVDKVVTGASYAIDSVACEGCGVCVLVCPTKAIDFPERRCGIWMRSETRCGPMVHAQLGVAAENSGKLVTHVRTEARRIAEQQSRDLIIIDGPPGIGCSAIASITGTSLALIITEPTVSGKHDLERVLALTRHFGVASAVCINKWDLNPAMTEQIENRSLQLGARLAGRVRYDRSVTLAQMQGLAVVETDAPSSEDIRSIWKRLEL
ncbi:MAG: ATP-binding protein [Burkholderiaceae bacterium]|nr:ATP-binding protein [Burkholderiaceae bacterium]